MWQSGPEYLTQPLELWPIGKSCENELPARINVSLQYTVNVLDNANLDVINFTDSAVTLNYCELALVLFTVFKDKSIKDIFHEPCAELLEKAEKALVKKALRSLGNDWNLGINDQDQIQIRIVLL